MKKVSSRPRVVNKGKPPPEGGVTKGKMPKKTSFQKLLEGWPPKAKKSKSKRGK